MIFCLKLIQSVCVRFLRVNQFPPTVQRGALIVDFKLDKDKDVNGCLSLL